MLVRIVSNYFTAGFVVENGSIKECAPILYYMKKWSLKQVEEYCKKKGWTYEQYV